MIANVQSRWVAGNIEFFDISTGTTLFTIKAGEPITLTAAQINALPIVLQAAIIDIAAADGTAAVGATPTKAEYDVLVTLANANKAKINDILAKLRLANIIV